MQALILAGGEGTRLRPLTSTMAKPVVPLAGRPFITYMLDWLRGHGVEEAILACGFLAGDVRAVLGDGAELGIALTYIEEPRALGTAGALKYAEHLLGERFLMLNGDVLTDIDVGAQLRQHEATGARATLALVEVEDPSAYGLVRCGADHAVVAFVEKPDRAGPDEPPEATPSAGTANLVNAGVYVLERDVLGEIASAGTPSSIEHDVFPRLVGRGLFGYEASGYWLDIGTPERYLRATFDLLERAPGLRSQTPAGGQIGQGTLEPSLIAEAEIGKGATIGPYAVIGCGAVIGEGARIERSVVLEGASIGAGTRIAATIVGPRARVGDDCRIEGDVVLGAGAVVESGSVVASGARIFPGVVVSEEAISK